jgi:hypothetical protein
MAASKHVPNNDPTLEIPLAMEAVFAKIEAETNSFNPGDEEVRNPTSKPFPSSPKSLFSAQ